MHHIDRFQGPRFFARDGHGLRAAGAAGSPAGGRGGKPHGFGEGRGDARGHGRGHGRGEGRGDGRGRGPRLFEHGALKLLALGLLAERPCHGYEIIKAIEEMVGGGYSPSPGVIYPTLTWLADIGWAAATDAEGGRKQYAITADGRARLDEQRAELDALHKRLRATRREASARGAPEIERAMCNLKMALQLRFSQGAPDKTLIRQVAEAIDQAAVAIERL